ncbi:MULTISPECIES: hypothetical protein [Nostocales]|nr:MULTISPECIES: hypothetical protein [Nostocales]
MELLYILFWRCLIGSDRCGTLSDSLQDVIDHFKRSLSSIKH